MCAWALSSSFRRSGFANDSALHKFRRVSLGQHLSSGISPVIRMSCLPKCLVQGPETSKLPKVVRRGCKRCFGLPRLSCTIATLVCTSSTPFCTSATGFWSPPHTHTHRNTFCTLSYPLLAILRFRPLYQALGIATHVLSWAIFLSEGFRGISEQFRARSLQPFALKCRMGVRRSTPKTTPGRSNSPKIDVRPTCFNMAGFRSPGVTVRFPCAPLPHKSPRELLSCRKTSEAQ